MATSAHTLRPPRVGAQPAETADAPRSGFPALRWLMVPAVGVAIFAALRRRAREPRTQYMSDEWLRANGRRRQYDV